jgi:hypothetical protein
MLCFELLPSLVLLLKGQSQKFESSTKATRDMAQSWSSGDKVRWAFFRHLMSSLRFCVFDIPSDTNSICRPGFGSNLGANKRLVQAAALLGVHQSKQQCCYHMQCFNMKPVITSGSDDGIAQA